MADKIVEPKTTEVALKPEVKELLNELRGLMRNLDPKKTNDRLIKRTLATVKAVIADLEGEMK
jgi:hypothetical protein